ncbi:ABC transporter permease [Psychromonas antarctica]|jgi:putative ABC transport system permease protein|uniref:ABC transporter permease n=1 Tax=Psychromonas antarctica TaxID=67573 RepID=UPI001EE9363C|nr:ABC transporter permease [Psychromonas antarctica]MCG6202681.1 ABC transporter permease [Psychromonas antarctica]
MSTFAFLGTLEIGFIYGLVALGVYLTFRILDFPDLTVDGSFTLGAAVTATLIVAGVNPYLATLLGTLAAASAGLVTAWLNLRFNILHLLASILTMTALYTINLRVMGKPNVALIMEPTVLTPFEGLGLANMYLKVGFVAVCALIGGLLVAWFLNTQYGLAMRAVGSNKRMAQANGIVVNEKVYVGLALSNGLVGLAGALFAQTNGFADSTMGIGTIVVGLAAVIIGESLFASRSILVIVLSCIVGSLLYRVAVSMALNADFLGFHASDLNLITAVLVALALVFPKLRNEWKAKRAQEDTL